MRRAGEAAEQVVEEHQQEGDGDVREGRAGVQGPPPEEGHNIERQVQDRAGHPRPGRQEDRDAPPHLGQGEQGLRLHLRDASAACQRQARAPRGHRRHRGPRDQGGLPRGLEAVSDRAQRRPAVAACPVAGAGPAALQAGADVHPGRDRLRAGPQPHAEHRRDDPPALPPLSVHHRVAEGRYVQPRERALPNPLHRRHIDRRPVCHPGRRRQGRGPREGRRSCEEENEEGGRVDVMPPCHDARSSGCNTRA
mmetsp:Transcript_1908/g.5128  ORF Transcript_1908/g.5128 Transcript_1908/m.5128 type:complete len:251 (+) Transcript_1908:3008-3760(+)